jgi:hypothetical protein
MRPTAEATRSLRCGAFPASFNNSCQIASSRAGTCPLAARGDVKLRPQSQFHAWLWNSISGRLCAFQAMRVFLRHSIRTCIYMMGLELNRLMYDG